MKGPKHTVQGFHLFSTPDAGGHGQSQGAYVGMGWHDRLDIISWMLVMEEKIPRQKLHVLYGVSMESRHRHDRYGRKPALQCKSGVEDCGYTSMGCTEIPMNVQFRL